MNSRILRSFSVILILTLVSVSCNKDVTSTEVLPPVTPASNDPGAGNWQMIVLTGPTQIAVPAPAPVTDPEYVAELASIKTAQTTLTDQQRQAMAYWSGGGVLRWNEILRELVARADLPPAPNPDGTYPVPDPKNPFGYPTFPFGNPPYAARAYSYITVAQYEALKAAWYYKYLYNRPSPSKVDSTIKALVPTTDLPAYPSEDAVLSGVTAALLKLLFPTSVDEITQKAAEQQQAANLSGKAAASDIAAGLALGQAVAAVFASRASTDGMKAAGGSPALWKALADAAIARGEIPWISREIPPRPRYATGLWERDKDGWLRQPTSSTSGRRRLRPHLQLKCSRNWLRSNTPSTTSLETSLLLSTNGPMGLVLSHHRDTGMRSPFPTSAKPTSVKSGRLARLPCSTCPCTTRLSRVGMRNTFTSIRVLPSWIQAFRPWWGSRTFPPTHQDTPPSQRPEPTFFRICSRPTHPTSRPCATKPLSPGSTEAFTTVPISKSGKTTASESETTQSGLPKMMGPIRNEGVPIAKGGLAKL